MSDTGKSLLAPFVREHLNSDWQDGRDLDDALVQGVIAAIRNALGPRVTARQINAAFPDLPTMNDFGVVDLDDPDAVIDHLDPYLAVAEGLPDSFWSECRLSFHERVVRFQAGEQGPSVDLGLVTDGDTDWWFTFLNTNAGENSYGPPSPATPATRRDEIRGVLEEWNPFGIDYVITSLRGTDLEWLTALATSAGAVTRTVDGSLQEL